MLTATVQAQDSVAARIAAVRVTVTRDAARPTFELPYAITRLGIESSRPAVRRASLSELLLLVPGVVVWNRFNPTQDPRLAIRGFGARSAFGIRGARVLRDGIPLTLADGQTAVDYLDLETIESAELIRGSAGALYGNSSGGVIDFRTEPPPERAVARVHAFYADEIKRGSLYGGGHLGPLGVQGTVTRNEGEGPRNYSELRNTNVLADARWTAGGTGFQAQFTRFRSPLAQNPGALTAVEMDTNRTMADPAQIRKKTGKAVSQSLVALQAAHEGERGSLSINLHRGVRALDNPQTFAIVGFDRSTFGGSLRGQYNVIQPSWTLRLAAGADLLNQSDERNNWANCAGITGVRPATCPGTSDRGTLTLDQRERVRGTGVYGRAEVSPSGPLSFTGTLRHDRTRFAVLDHRATNSVEQSRTLSAVTPMVGVNWRVRPAASVYANMSESFETPTTTELGNQPDGSTGLNRTLKPQHGRTYEVGAKGIWQGQLTYDLALFRTSTTDELIPFDIPGGGGRRYFRNAGRTLRRGAEAGLALTRGIATLGTTSSWLRYTYEDYVVAGTSYNGKRVPGVAPNTWTTYATLRPRWGLVAAELQHVAKLPADDANRNYADGYSLLNARAALDIGTRLGLQPVVGIDNIFDETYAANVAVNASASRFFEPGAGRTVYVAVRVTGRR